MYISFLKSPWLWRLSQQRMLEFLPSFLSYSALIWIVENCFMWMTISLKFFKPISPVTLFLQTKDFPLFLGSKKLPNKYSSAWRAFKIQKVMELLKISFNSWDRWDLEEKHILCLLIKVNQFINSHNRLNFIPWIFSQQFL